MSRERRMLTREEAKAYTRDLERRADALGIPLDQWILRPGRPNDIRLGKGPRFAIVQRAQACAEGGGRYGDVLGAKVIQGNGTSYRIGTHDLAGFVCANGYCMIEPPGSGACGQVIPSKPDNRPHVTMNGADADLGSGQSESQGNLRPRLLPKLEGEVTRPNERVLEVMKAAYPCPSFQTACKSMRWNPGEGHIPRGFLGATGHPEEVELVLVFAEPGDPMPGDHASMEEAIRHATWAFREGSGAFHQNARWLFEACWPGLPFEAQLRKVWLTESVLCSAEVTTGPVSAQVERACGQRYLARELMCFPNALVVALGQKATQRMGSLGMTGFESAFAFGKPGCFQAGAKPSWQRIADLITARRQRDLPQ